MEIQRIKVIENMHKNGLVGIVRDNNEADAMTRTRAIRDGGCSILEISMSTPGALNIIETVAKEIKEKNAKRGKTSLPSLDSVWDIANYLVGTGGSCFYVAQKFITIYMGEGHRIADAYQ
ncbi:MAG: hypothetical protein IJN63_05525, partial [Clostridia bacterium]|nr:hypothetical protein [Clostridia bacterium]